jgi:hypothetical protein
MNSGDLDRVFKYRPNTPEQDQDLTAVYRDAKQLAETIGRCVDEKYAQQAIAQLVGVLSLCRNAIETAPRQEKPLVLV